MKKPLRRSPLALAAALATLAAALGLAHVTGPEVPTTRKRDLAPHTGAA